MQSCNADTNEYDKLNDFFSVKVSSPHEGYLYINGNYTGKKTPTSIELEKGNYTIGVAQDATKTYLRKEIVVENNIELALTKEDKPTPKKWKALWIGVETVTHNNCTSSYTKSDLDAAYDYFNWSIKEHFEKFSYNTTQWEVAREDYTEPIELTQADNGLILSPVTIAKLKPELSVGDYDAVFCFYREKEGECHMQGNFFGLAWLNPMEHDFKSGFVIVKFDDHKAGSVAERLQWYKDNDPGVWCHEWLHTVGEGFYQKLNCQLPEKNHQGLVIHSAQTYKYTYPWLNWYEDIMSARVPSQTNPNEYLGIGPEAFLKHNVRDIATK